MSSSLMILTIPTNSKLTRNTNTLLVVCCYYLLEHRTKLLAWDEKQTEKEREKTKSSKKKKAKEKRKERKIVR